MFISAHTESDILVIIAEPESNRHLIDAVTSDSFTGTHSKGIYLLAQEKAFVH